VTAIDDGHNVLILSGPGVDAKARGDPAAATRVPPCAAPRARGHSHAGGIVVETAGGARGARHALLVGYGAATVNPYLALDHRGRDGAELACPGTERRSS